MSATVRTPECFPELCPSRLFLGGFVAEARHADCPGGHHVPGVIGGWHCPCPCHRSSSNSALPPSAVQPRSKSTDPDRLKITVSDVVTGEVLGEQIIYDDYLLICAGHPYLAHTQAHANGTHVLTIKDAGKRTV